MVEVTMELSEKGKDEIRELIKLELFQYGLIPDNRGYYAPPHEDVVTARWVDIVDPIEQLEAAFGIKLEKWQVDYIEHIRRGERLVPKGRSGSEWVPDERIERE